MGPRTLREITRSVPVSFLSFLADFGILALLTEVFGLFYLLSAGISFMAGVTISYVISVGWIFRSRRIASRGAEYALFVLVGAVGLAMNEGLLWVFTERVGLFYLLSKIIAGAIVFFWNFGARKYILFRERPPA